MKITLTTLAGVLALAGVCASAAQQQAPSRQKGPLSVLPGAAGFGMDTPAGSGRNLEPPRTTVDKVTNLNTSGPGSLAAGLEAEGPRVIVFEVSGNIDFRPYRALAINNPYLTVAGQTAPSPGITLVGCELHVNAHDVLLQHIRVRVGDLTDPTRPEVDPKSGWSQWSERDYLKVNAKARRIVIDHCSLSWEWMEKPLPPERDPERSKVSQPPVVVPNLEIRPATAVREWVLATAGARPMDRDPVDARIIQEVRNRTGNIPSSQEDVGGWPELAKNRRELNLPADPNGDDDGDGYTNLEEWLHGVSGQKEPGGARQTEKPSGE